MKQDGKPLSGRVALVSGGGRGIGRAISLALADDGADVAVNYRRDEASAKQTVADIEARGRRAAALRASVERFEEDEAMVAEALATFGHVDILVHSAGIASRGQSVVDTDPAELERVVRVHALAPHYLAKLLIPSMRERPRGDVVLISSTATRYMAPFSAPYNMAKAAMEALAFTLAKEVRGQGIRVNVVAPGLVDTEMGRRLVKASQGVDDIRELDATMPFGHVCKPEEVADAVRFLVSERGAYITGQRLCVDGGGF